MPGGRSTRALSWGYQGNNGNKYAQDHEGEPFKEKFGIGDTIGCGFKSAENRSRGAIYFTRNGEYLGLSASLTLQSETPHTNSDLGTAFNNVKASFSPFLA